MRPLFQLVFVDDPALFWAGLLVTVGLELDHDEIATVLLHNYTREKTR